jgi:DNA processing protein
MQLGGMGFTIVSGMARGIDTESHRAAIQSGAPTIAVLGCGLSRIDSLHDPELALEICENGALISELPMDAPPLPKHFPPRNRLISGLSLGVVVLEARKRSGSLITARHAGEQGKDVFALPGNVTSGSSSGCHKLIRDGATLVENPVEIIEELGPLSSPVELPRRDNSLSRQTSGEGYTLEDPRVLSINERERQVFEMLSHTPVQIDDLTDKAGLPSSVVSSTLLTLEIRGLIKRLPGQNYVRT